MSLAPFLPFLSFLDLGADTTSSSSSAASSFVPGSADFRPWHKESQAEISCSARHVAKLRTTNNCGWTCNRLIQLRHGASTLPASIGQHPQALAIAHSQHPSQQTR